MKIGIFTDLRFTELTTPTGVTKHIVQMVKGLYDEPLNEIVLLVAKDQLMANGELPEYNALSYLELRVLPYTWQFIYWKTFFIDTFFFDHYTKDLDWVYCPKNDYLPLKETKYAVTFHGAHELDPNYPNPKGLLQYLNKIRSRRRYMQMVAQATKILTVSEFLKEKTLEWFKADASKIVIIGNGVEEEFYDIAKFGNYCSNGPLLSVGGLNFLDGGDRLIKIAEYLKDIKDPRVIFVAGNQHDDDLIEQSNKLANIKLLGYLRKNELANKMSESSMLLFLTRYETFGIAAAEAMVVGIPVITTNSTAVPEIVGEAGIYLDEGRLNEMYDEFLGIHDFELNIRTGKTIANEYRWSSCVERLIKALN